MKEYEKRIEQTRYKNLGKHGNSSSSGFKIEYDKSGNTDVPIRRFGPINKKIKEFPLLETSGNIFLYDFGDGFGQVYAYRWKNDPNQGIVSYWARFENPQNISIDKNSTVSSNCYLFAKSGIITISQTKLISTQLWANRGSITLSQCPEIRDCYIFGSVNINQVSLSERTRFFTNDCTLTRCSISGNNLFYQDELDYSGSINIEPNVSISGHCEIIGNVSIEPDVSISDRVKIAGNVSIQKSVQLSDDVYVNSGKNGFITIQKEAQLSENCIIINNATIGQQSKISGMAFVGDSAIIGEQVKLSDECCILDNAVIGNQCDISGKSLVNMSAVLEPQVKMSGNGIATGKVTLKTGTIISGYGIVAGNGTVKNSSTVSGNGRVFDGIDCEHSVSGEHRHWDNRSCKNQIDTLVDERESCVAPCDGSCLAEMPPPTIC